MKELDLDDILLWVAGQGRINRVDKAKKLILLKLKAKMPTKKEILKKDDDGYHNNIDWQSNGYNIALKEVHKILEEMLK